LNFSANYIEISKPKPEFAPADTRKGKANVVTAERLNLPTEAERNTMEEKSLRTADERHFFFFLGNERQLVFAVSFVGAA